MTEEIRHIYFDHSATTPVDERVFQAMTPYLREVFGNPSSMHFFGQKAEAAVEEARQQIASAINCKPGEVVFTSCGSESDNLALRGAAFAARQQRGARHLLITPVEHHAVTHTAQQMVESFGFELEYLPVDRYGRVNPEDVVALVRPDTALVSVIYANNEIGTCNPIPYIGATCRDLGATFHTDAVQAPAWLPMDVQALNVDLLSIGAHKFYGPKGAGALYVRAGTSLLPMQTGGAQESRRRAGTENVPYIVGMARALKICQAEYETRALRVLPLRELIIRSVLEEIPDSQLTGHPIQRLPNHASFVFHETDSNTLLMLLDQAGFACSSGSACKTGNPEPSSVLLALKFAPKWASGSLRVSLGYHTSDEEVEAFIEQLPGIVQKARTLSKSA